MQKTPSNSMEKLEQVACRKLIKSGKTSLKYRGVLFEVIEGSVDYCKIRAYHPHLSEGITRTITCFYGGKTQ